MILSGNRYPAWKKISVKSSDSTISAWRSELSPSMGSVRMHHTSPEIATQPSHSVERAEWQAKMAFIEFRMPLHNAHRLHLWIRNTIQLRTKLHNSESSYSNCHYLFRSTINVQLSSPSSPTGSIKQTDAALCNDNVFWQHGLNSWLTCRREVT